MCVGGGAHGRAVESEAILILNVSLTSGVGICLGLKEDEIFGATITLIEKWQISRLDVADYLACADRTAWVSEPTDAPPYFEDAHKFPCCVPLCFVNVFTTCQAHFDDATYRVLLNPLLGLTIYAHDHVYEMCNVCQAPLSFDPPSFEITNAAHNMYSTFGAGKAASGMSVQKERTHLVIEANRTVVAVRPTRISGYFFQEFELQNYPFDSQVLQVQLKSLRLPQATCSYVKVEEAAGSESSAEPLIRHTEWLYRDDNSYSSFEPDKKLSDFDTDRGKLFGSLKHAHYDYGLDNEANSLRATGQDNNPSAIKRVQASKGHGKFVLTVQCKVSRYYATHVFRVGCVMALFSLAAVTTMMPHDQSTSMERITLLVTLMLTATTYSLTVAESLPTLPYLTIIDKYVLGTFGYFGIIGLELAIIDWSTFLDWPGETNMTQDKYTLISGGEFAASYRATLANLILWTVLHIVMFIHITMSIAAYEKKSAMKLSPDELERAKATLDIIRRNIAFGKQVKRKPTIQEVDAVVEAAARTWIEKTFGKKQREREALPASGGKKIRNKVSPLAGGLDGAKGVPADGAAANKLNVAENPDPRRDSMKGVKMRSASFILSRAQKNVAARNLKARRHARPRRSQTAADVVELDVCSDSESESETVSYFSNPIPIISAESVIIPGANGTDSDETLDGAGGFVGSSIAPMIVAHDDHGGIRRALPSDSEALVDAFLSEIRHDDESSKLVNDDDPE